MHAMRMGPGKHLQGLTLMNGTVTPEEVGFMRIVFQIGSHKFQFDYFHELIITQEFVRTGNRGYGDGKA